jgi:hypothetical protein
MWTVNFFANPMRGKLNKVPTLLAGTLYVAIVTQSKKWVL